MAHASLIGDRLIEWPTLGACFYFNAEYVYPFFKLNFLQRLSSKNSVGCNYCKVSVENPGRKSAARGGALTHDPRNTSPAL